jgi:hypothetical protein
MLCLCCAVSCFIAACGVAEEMWGRGGGGAAATRLSRPFVFELHLHHNREQLEQSGSLYELRTRTRVQALLLSPAAAVLLDLRES